MSTHPMDYVFPIMETSSTPQNYDSFSTKKHTVI